MTFSYDQIFFKTKYICFREVKHDVINVISLFKSFSYQCDIINKKQKQKCLVRKELIT